MSIFQINVCCLKLLTSLCRELMRRNIRLLLAMLFLLIHLLTFSLKKVAKIHAALVARNRDLLLADDDELPTNAAELNKFHEFSQDVKEFAY